MSILKNKMAWVEEIFKIFDDISATLSGENNLFFTLLFFTAVIVIYAVFVYYFYKYLAKKNIIELNLAQYGDSGSQKFLATFFYIIEYLIILPILTFFGFAVFAVLILVLSEGISASTILIISAALVASVRITAHISENISQELAKMIPFTFLAIAIITPNFFNVSALIMRFSEIPSLFSNLVYYLIFIVIIEILMRVAELIGKIANKE